MKQKYIYGTIALALVALLAVSAVTAFPFGNGFMNQEMTDEQRTQLQEEQQAMQTAIENNDFEAWQTLMQSRITKMQQEITQENFQKMIEKNSEMQAFRDAMQQAHESGDYSKVEELQAQYGFEGKGRGIHQGMGEGKGMRQGSCPFADSE